MLSHVKVRRGDFKLDNKLIISLFPVMFFFHDFEEILTMSQWVDSHKDELYSKVPERFHFLVQSVQLSMPQVAIAVLVELLILSLVTFLTVKSVNSKFRMVIFTGFLTMLFLNVFTHLAQSIFFGGYTPGVVTAVLVSLPYSYYTYRRLIKAGFIKTSTLASGFVVAILCLPMVPFAHYVGRMLG